MVRLNITLPDEVAQQIANKKNKSRFIADALKEKLARDEKKKMEELLLQGYKAVAQDDENSHGDWQGVELEGWE